VAAITIEDTALPTPYGAAEGKGLTSIEEGVGKLRAALAARSDPALTIIARTSALQLEGLQGLVERARAYSTIGVDAFMIVGLTQLSELEAVREAIHLPIIVGTAPDAIKAQDLAALGALVVFRGHHPFAAAIKALQETYAHMYNGGTTATLATRIASAQDIKTLTEAARYEEHQRAYLS
jgi:carboxyvinyl-carboxyphosphonate phosphorylmutase